MFVPNTRVRGIWHGAHARVEGPEETIPLAASWRFHCENAMRAARHTARPLATPDLSAVPLP
jgi:hypothetical protein